MLEIQHIPKCFMLHKGDLVGALNGVPKDGSEITAFFNKAAGLADGTSTGE